MKTISAKIVDQTWRKMAIMSPLQIPKLVNKFANEQPVIFAYLLAAGEDLLNQDEKELLLYLGTVIWQIMSQGSTPLPKVTEETLYALEDSNFKMVEYLEGEPEADIENTVAKIYSSYNQPEVLRYVAEALFEEDEEGEEIREEMKGIIFIYLKTVIDCFDK